MSSVSRRPPELLVIGAGFAGVHVAKSATASGFDVTIVDRKDFFDIKFASVRTCVQPKSKLAEDHLIPYTKIIGLGTFKQCSVLSIGKDSAQLSTGEVIKFDYLVLATGSTNAAGAFAQPQCTELAARRTELLGTADEISKAKSVAIVGGGAVGIELCCEIVEAYAGKKVTIIHPGKSLFENSPAKIGIRVRQWLDEHSVAVRFNERAKRDGSGNGKVLLESGTELDADLVIWTVGSTPNTEWLKATEFGSILDKQGRVKVEPDLRVVGYPNVWALGDINDVKEEKLGYLATLQAQLTGKNLAAIKKNKAAKLTAWKPYNGTKAMFLTLGKDAGAGFLGSCVFFSFLVAQIKSKGLFVEKVRGEIGVKA